ncbi:hypothetical protein MA5S0921_2215 [Mycobacteroides abscessus 5S-0921]|nr:hypothetical protein MA5S0304_1484 [Mycobacteroides abscessus 5S-0304]EIU14205.1 hypothetical protein MA5S0421_1735 [Mycobacteroides abscessus 5S-0421]EIU27168.1 hypothetical protein MA5S0817_1515 [Mycobacteroides abscessus 5S-0817]EIU49734.1 hypothetical protein MA5S1215_0504 [Mycobacteroides abscessus 5S-1215]EIU92682.1 hypothetical protein MA5S0921_2215 [Mycobacteroides abscessus 5S-0921]
MFAFGGTDYGERDRFVASGYEAADSGTCRYRIYMHVTVVLPQRCDAAVEFVVHPVGQILRPGADSEHR